MSLPEIQKIINQSTAALDQYWEVMEVIFPYASTLSGGLPKDIDDSNAEIARLCCQLVAWELGVRCLKKNRNLKCKIISELTDLKSAVEISINTVDGQFRYVVPKNSIYQDEDGCKVKIFGHKMANAKFTAQLQTTTGQIAIVVEESEVVDGEPVNDIS